ncbi:hypothetical protein ACFLS9_07150 [Bacteroidota bacterium]
MSIEIKAVLLSISLLALVFYGCSGNNSDINVPLEENFETEEYGVFDFEDAMNSIEDATLEKDFGFNNYFEKGKFGRNHMPEFKGPMHHRFDKGKHLGRILQRLKLSEAQKEQVHEFMGDHRDCTAQPNKTIKDVAKTYLDEAKNLRKEIIDQLKNGELTRTEAKELLEELNQQTRQQIMSDESVIAAKEELCSCKLTLFESISPILDAKQLEIWNNWVAGIPDPCLDGLGG